jgi:outer membrane protein, adhesin transport system
MSGGDNMRYLSVFICFFSYLILFCSLPTGTAKAVHLPVITLQELLSDVTNTSPAILESIEHYKSVAAERSIATSEYLPTVGTQLSTGPEQTDGVPTNDAQKNLTATTASLFARQNLFSGFKTSAFVDETDARIKAAAFDVLTTANKTYLDACEAYINVVKTKELLRIAEQNAFTQEQIMRQVREKTASGFNRISELYSSESRLALSKASFISRQQDLNQALSKLHRLLGRKLEPEQFAVPVPSFNAPPTLEDTVAIAFENHPALKVADYNIQTKQHTYEKSMSAYWPTLDLEIKGQYREDTGGEVGDTTQTGAYLTLNYTFFDGGLRSGTKAKEQQSILKERQRAYIERRNVNESVRLAWNIVEAEREKKQYLTDHMMLSAKTLSAFKEEYYAGRRTLLDLLNMENEYTDAKLSRADSEFAYLVALYRIMQATGVLLEEHDTGLREMLDLSADRKEDLAGYEHVASDRDLDKSEDKIDQCDNSFANSPVESSGCIKSIGQKPGYPRDEDLSVAPYIEPKESTGPINYSTIKETSAQTEVIAKTDKGNRTIRLYAQPNSDQITAEAKVLLDTLIDDFQKIPGASILLEGYIASDTTSDENIALSERRADVVKAMLIDRGVNGSRITVVGRGNENPLAANDTPNGRKINRRVEATIRSN